ncbi:alpha-D-xyloside xylohydrolase [Pontibacter ummariensis]|uniref:Alpha-D-xyloside xylohydrolase n=1 Tax=Pontibacter ummariensis TaxID=1610492 RepID=A0A239HAW5_9BACT|nr:TIM-barrel domain-containing protein [Pontibacter ummariensis]PRY10720.1 alpha-D-xyloside xylohydrolase [Pontibacter ummariensis]SNS77394.1 alpha-D-xyloside xylohydrolase [Pontibacter ummariensis]
MRVKGLVYLLLFFMLSSFDGPSIKSYKKLDDGVVIELQKEKSGDPLYLKLQVVSDDIIHVSSTPINSFAGDPSLMVIKEGKKTKGWTVAENKDGLVLETKSLQARVSANTGEVTFLDKAGNVILQESNGGYQTFKPVTFGKEKGYALQKKFKAAQDEAFYGLGQHQTGQMNYRGSQVDLTQYNSVAVVPFLVSSKNYGILWDNNSITKFGDVRQAQPLSAFKLYSKDKKPGGLTATYVSDKKAGKAPIVRQESEIDYEFLSSLKQLPEGYSLEGGKVTWEGYLESDTSGVHRFRMPASGYTKVWIDGELLLDKWREAWNPGLSVFSKELKKGQKHPIKIEWDPDGSQSFISLRFLTPQSKAEQDKFAFASEAGDKLDYYFVNGKNMDEVISGYRELTGNAQIMPKWAMGFWQSRERYKTQQEILDIVAEYRKRDIPLDNIVLDWSYWKEDQWGSQEFDETRFPDPAGMIDQLHNKYNTHFMISVWPKFYEGIENYKLFDEKGLLYKQNIQNRERDWIGKGYVSTFYDAFNPEGQELFWELLDKKLYKLGVDAWWLDATEPDILSNASIEHRKSLMNPTYLGSADEYFNAYSLMNAKGIYEGQRETNPNDRVFILTRSAFGGLQRYGAATWSGDISARFDELKRQIPAGLNFSVSGLPYWTTDIGGFFVEDKYDRPDPKGEALEEWRELNTRWHQYGAFTPLYRSHGQYPYREVFNIAPEDHKAYQSIVYYNKLRYRLMPYLYSLAGHVYHKDYTIMRPLVMDFAQDKNVLNIGDQFMFGPSLLINPVTDYKATKRNLYLPANTGWYNLYTGAYQSGGKQIVADAPYEQMPIFVKEGAILPFGPEIEYTTEKPADEITLYVYGGKDASFDLYEDENTNYNYEKGKFASIPISYNEASRTLTIGQQQGEFEGMLQNRTFNVLYVRPDKPRALQLDAKPDKVISYSGKATSVKL